MKTKIQYIPLVVLFLIGSLTPVLFLTQKASAATFVVNSVLDTVDDNPGDGNCDDGAGNCTLRAAIEETNDLAGADTINFGIPGAGAHTITIGSALPDIIDQVTIDGSTEAGAACGDLAPDTLPAESNTPHTLMIEIDADGLTSQSGILEITSHTASNSIIRGLVINNMGTASGGIYVNNNSVSTNIDDVLIECNYVGTNVAGSAAVSAGTFGINIGQPTNRIIIRNNLVAGSQDNEALGIYLTLDASNFEVVGNVVGLDANATSVIGNQGRGIFAYFSNGIIEGNIVSGNNLSDLSAAEEVELGAIDIENSNGIVVAGNLVGLNISGDVVENGSDGINVFGSENVTIGGDTIGERNYIAGNARNGVRMYSRCNGASSLNNTVIGNYIGTNTTGAVEAGYGNVESGVAVNEYFGSCGTVSDIRIGGINDDAEANIIAGNGDDGVLIYQTPGTDVRDIAVLVNSIHSNGGIGINLAEDTDGDGIAETDLGVNPINSNQLTNPTTLANSYVNYAVINSATYNNSGVTVNYDLAANESDGSVEVIGYRLDIYLNTEIDGSGHGQGRTHLGYFIVSGSVDDAQHTFVPPIEVSDGMSVSATTTVLKTPVVEN